MCPLGLNYLSLVSYNKGSKTILLFFYSQETDEWSWVNQMSMFFLWVRSNSNHSQQLESCHQLISAAIWGRKHINTGEISILIDCSVFSGAYFWILYLDTLADYHPVKHLAVVFALMPYSPMKFNMSMTISLAMPVRKFTHMEGPEPHLSWMLLDSGLASPVSSRP